jgi:hypothetical protein
MNKSPRALSVAPGAAAFRVSVKVTLLVGITAELNLSFVSTFKDPPLTGMVMASTARTKPVPPTTGAAVTMTVAVTVAEQLDR